MVIGDYRTSLQEACSHPAQNSQLSVFTGLQGSVSQEQQGRAPRPSSYPAGTLMIMMTVM
jgi:hypothetical protein